LPRELAEAYALDEALAAIERCEFAETRALDETLPAMERCEKSEKSLRRSNPNER
jgi:hypothetical protein